VGGVWEFWAYICGCSATKQPTGVVEHYLYWAIAVNTAPPTFDLFCQNNLQALQANLWPILGQSPDAKHYSTPSWGCMDGISGLYVRFFPSYSISSHFIPVGIRLTRVAVTILFLCYFWNINWRASVMHKYQILTPSFKSVSFSSHKSVRLCVSNGSTHVGTTLPADQFGMGSKHLLWLYIQYVHVQCLLDDKFYSHKFQNI
jgi:hypothetical protein